MRLFIDFHDTPETELFISTTFISNICVQYFPRTKPSQHDTLSN